MASHWLAEEAAPLPRTRLAGRAEVEVVGGGVTGCAAAIALATAGARVRVHEAREIAGGASGRNGGFALRGGAMPYDDAVAQLGHAAARALWTATEDALDRIEALAGDAFRRRGSLRLAADDAERAALAAEYRALRAGGLAAEWLEDLDPPLARFRGAILHESDGALQPARWVRRLACLAAEAGAELRERSRVHSLAELEAEHVVIATDGYTRGLLPALDAAVRPARGQVLVTEPLERLLFPRPHYARHGYDYWQQTPDRRLVVGGRRDADLDAEWTAAEGVTHVVQASIEQLARELLGHLPRVSRRWSGIFGVTADRLPLAGRAPGSDRAWVACGYSGHGNVLGFLCGELVAQAILGRPDPLLVLFDPRRALSELELQDAV